MNQITITLGCILGALSIVFGAFGAHAIQKKLTQNQLKNFETGVKYQMYHAIVLLTIGLNIELQNILITSCFFIGTLFFSFSIYCLVLSEAFGKKIKFLGPVTPIGGLLLVIGWLLLLFQFI